MGSAPPRFDDLHRLRMFRHKRLGLARRKKAERHRFVIAMRHQRAAQFATGCNVLLHRTHVQADALLRRHMIKAIQPTDLFDQVHLAHQIEAIGGNGADDALAILPRRQAEAVEQLPPVDRR